MGEIRVQLSEYNSNWEQQYADEQNRIKEALGDKAIRIEHIGSTSIKGLEAKPIIDILVGVPSLEEVVSFIDALSKIDYEYVPKLEFNDRKFFRKGLWGQGTSHLHICEYNSNEWIEKLLFRDYLRTHPEAATEYAMLKKQLATKYSHDRSTYTKEKEPFIHLIISKAKTVWLKE
ncbi:GrpB family protein [Lysinibacillus sp. fls2-241-R2A-57]|uniref:GrpB family protein n=1 Tax=Lysinibacillus sp. fls2-241-R2A-57 TaxID=3040292 RepID=UPI00255500A9|nr:GrpB family protein [Lysinibacillus sp. fls2-241-R2A-57]